MSPSVSITTRATKTGKRYVVRYRRGGRAHPLIHAGSFKRERDARTRRDLVAGELAAGRDPRVMLTQLTDPVEIKTFVTRAHEWLATRIDLKATTRDTYRDAITWLATTTLADLDPTAVTSAQIQEAVTSSGLAATSLQTYMSVVKQTLDFCGRDPNPARGHRVRLPRAEREPIRIPTSKQVDAIILRARPSVKLPLRLLAETGVRVGELLAWTWGDVDIDGSQILIPKGKTRSARRWVPIPPDLMDQILELCPPDGRGRERRLFDLGDSTLRGAMLSACVAAKVPHYSPHDFRHRYISVLLKRGLSRAEVAAAVGHSNTNELATYEHVVVEDV